MHCDQGTNFVGAQGELRKAIEEIDSERIKEQLRKDTTDWVLNPAKANNFGVAWERHIRSLRINMSALIVESAWTEAR